MISRNIFIMRIGIRQILVVSLMLLAIAATVPAWSAERPAAEIKSAEGPARVKKPIDAPMPAKKLADAIVPAKKEAAKDVGVPALEGPKMKEFRRLHAEMNEILADLREKQIRYFSADPEKKTEIESLWKDDITKGEKLEPRLIAAAEAAYTEAPNASKPLADFLLMVLSDKVQNDEYELAAEIGDLLMKHHCPSKSLPNMAGVAAFAVSDFDAAEKYFAEAIKQEYYTAAQKDNKIAKLGAMFIPQIPYLKTTWPQEAKLREHESESKGLPRVVFKTTKGDIVFELFENQAPNTVANFISLVQSGFYTDTPFHRVEQGFMAQGGDPTGTGTGGPGYTIPCECYFSNHRNHFRGSLSMANTGHRDTGGSQFFITFTPQAHLDGLHTVFGRVIEGMDVLAKIQRRDPADREAPRADKILKATVLRKRNHDYTPQKRMN